MTQVSTHVPLKVGDVPLHKNVLRAIQEKGYTEFTQIQSESIPHIIAGKDVFGHSATGSGKTAAFGLPMLDRLAEKQGNGIKALILTPTRELCVQVSDSIKEFAKYTKLRIATVYGGSGFQPQVRDLERADIVVGTPGRIKDHISRRTIRLDNVHFFVLDEADKMLEMGFIDDVEDILQSIPKERQTLLFSATMPDAILRMCNKHLRNPVHVKANLFVDRSKLKQHYYEVQSRDKFSLLNHLVAKNHGGLTLIFCATRREVDVVNRNLKSQKHKCMAIHGGLSQNQRLRALDALKHEHISILVATDVAARGLDIKNVQFVYNYDVAKTREEHLHRIGRTARAGKEGTAITLVSNRDYDYFKYILRDRDQTFVRENMPEFERIAFDRMAAPERHGRFEGGRGDGFSRGGRFGRDRPRFERSEESEHRAEGQPERRDGEAGESRGFARRSEGGSDGESRGGFGGRGFSRGGQFKRRDGDSRGGFGGRGFSRGGQFKRRDGDSRGGFGKSAERSSRN